MPGPFDYEAGICLIRDQNKYPMLYGLNVKEHAGAGLAINADDIYINNDAACFLQGEVFCGSVSGLPTCYRCYVGNWSGNSCL